MCLMSYSTDSLRKKVCVTVFLDELFEEIYSEDGEISKQLSGVESSGLAASETEHEEPAVQSESLAQDESEQDNSTRKGTDVRPRKHRRESKFSKNPCKVLNNFNRYNGHLETRYERKPGGMIESGISESEADDGLILESVSKKTVGESMTDTSEVEAPEECLPSKIIYCTSSRSQSVHKLDVNCQYDVILYSSKSTQVEVGSVPVTNADQKVGDSISLLEEEQKQLVEDLAWRKTQKQIQLILSKAKSWYEVKEACEGDRIRRYDLRSILEECEKADDGCGLLMESKTYSMTEAWSTDFYESDTKDLSDSYTCVFPHNRRRVGIKASALRRVSNRRLGRDGFESDLSEVDEGLPLPDYHKLLCYTSCINCKQDAFRTDPKENENDTQSPAFSDDTTRDSSLESLKSKPSDKSQPSRKSLESEEKVTLVQTYSEFSEAGIDSVCEAEVENSHPEPSEKLYPTPQYSDTMSKIVIAKREPSGDNFDWKRGCGTSEILLCLESKEKLLICEEILKRVADAADGPKKIIITPKEIEVLEPYDKEDIRIPDPPQGIAEVFIKRKFAEEKDKIMSEVESETIFADNVNYTESKDLYEEPSTCAVPLESGREKQGEGVCVLEYEDELSRSRVLRRMKTVEILGEGSTNDMKNISAEVILICENISHKDVCLEAWQSSVSTMKSLSEVGQCYLKDSKDSSMYLIEIPFHFTRAKKKEVTEASC